MSKNMTRKGLALGATLSLAISGLIATTPAQAAVGITLEPKLGTEYTMIEGETFTLNAFGNVEFPSGNAGQLRVKVTNKTANGSFDGFAINGTTYDHVAFFQIESHAIDSSLLFQITRIRNKKNLTFEKLPLPTCPRYLRTTLAVLTSK